MDFVRKSHKTQSTIFGLSGLASSWGTAFLACLLFVGSSFEPTRALVPAEEVKKTVERYIQSRSKNGSFLYRDEKTGDRLLLDFVGVQGIRGMPPYGDFVDVEFAVHKEPQKHYRLNFWVEEKDGKPKIVDIRIYKEPAERGGQWVEVTRQPLLWWWVPVTEHPGEREEKRAWEIKAAIHQYIAGQKGSPEGTFRIHDPKSGKDLELELVAIHDPVRKLPGKGYFACTDFHPVGEPEKLYDLDFWVAPKDHRLEVTEVRIHKEPVLENGRWIQKPRFEYRGIQPIELP
ncbi:hypothetical protein [Candidatus Methylacidithermus pantelleriae]|uniref:Uncharacterized protein n=1 Tax=Candidatus Methylacidithermus pantelleriae TaxID=2744239 RepID=A0A8J2BG66_9BACT|nr:hypothetical protein [Candidatus Methylacidithermus pantelleriae]CAF0689825.1 conserved hypothetical protein [Candidatus Methylacidithermus pantelleriae]